MYTFFFKMNVNYEQLLLSIHSCFSHFRLPWHVLISWLSLFCLSSFDCAHTWPVADYYGLSDLLDLVTLAGGFKFGWSGSEQTNMKGLVCPHSLENTCYKCFVVCWISFTVWFSFENGEANIGWQSSAPKYLLIPDEVISASIVHSQTKTFMLLAYMLSQ